MPAEPIRGRGHAQQHGGQADVVAQPVPGQQHGIGRFVEREAAGRDDEEAQRRGARRSAVAAERQPVVAGEGHAEGDQPAQHVGAQRPPARAFDQRHHDGPVHQRGQAADGDEEGDAAPGVEAVHGAAEHSHSRALCLCVDDFGLHAGINGAALRLAVAGRVHAIGCLVGGPAFGSGGRLLRRLALPGLDIGLHLDLTEAPLRPGSRQSLPAWLANSLLRRLDAHALHAEIRAQLDAFEDALGRLPAFVDGHQHVHQLPGVRTALLDELQQRYGTARPWLRCTRTAGGAAAPFKARVIEALGARGLATLADSRGFAQNRRLLGVYDFRGGAARYRRLLEDWFRQAAAGDLLMCHPSLAAPASDALAAARQAEFQVLSSANFERWLREAGLHLQPMSRTLAHRPRPA